MVAQLSLVADTGSKYRGHPTLASAFLPFWMSPPTPAFVAMAATTLKIHLVAYSAGKYALQMGLLNARLLSSGLSTFSTALMMPESKPGWK